MPQSYAPRADHIANLGSGARQHPAMYHLPGGGPSGATCGTCASFLGAGDKGRGRCARWLEHRGRGAGLIDRAVDPHWSRGLPTIAASNASCKYWVRARSRLTPERAP
jgi:hypothetical protein